MILLDTTLTGFTPNEMIIELVSDYVVNELLNPTPPSPGNGIDPGGQWQNPESGQSGQEGGGPSAGNGGPEAKKRTKMAILCSGRGGKRHREAQRLHWEAKSSLPAIHRAGFQNANTS